MDFLLQGLISFVVGVAIGAAIIMLATKLVAGFMPKFLNAAIAALVASIAGTLLLVGIPLVLGAGMLSSLLALVGFFVVNSAILNALVKSPSGAAMGFGKAALVTLLEIVIYIVLCIILFFVCGAALMAVFGGMAGAIH